MFSGYQCLDIENSRLYVYVWKQLMWNNRIHRLELACHQNWLNILIINVPIPTLNVHEEWLWTILSLFFLCYIAPLVFASLQCRSGLNHNISAQCVRVVQWFMGSAQLWEWRTPAVPSAKNTNHCSLYAGVTSPASLVCACATLIIFVLSDI